MGSVGLRSQALGACAGVLLAAGSVCGQVTLPGLGTPYTQDFDTLASSGTSSGVPTGWALRESGSNANATYTASTGSSPTGDTYSFGSMVSSERAFGGLQTGTLIPTIGASFQNDTGGTITSLDIAYTGEQWRGGNTGAPREDRLNFQYSLDATGPRNGHLDGGRRARFRFASDHRAGGGSPGREPAAKPQSALLFHHQLEHRSGSDLLDPLDRCRRNRLGRRPERG
jgi:hypothetical protein